MYHTTNGKIGNVPGMAIHSRAKQQNHLDEKQTITKRELIKFDSLHLLYSHFIKMH